MSSCNKELFVFFFNDTATTEIYTLSLHDALPILAVVAVGARGHARGDRLVELRRVERPLLARVAAEEQLVELAPHLGQDRKSTRLNSSHANISYAVFCLKKKKHLKFLYPYKSYN